MVVSRGPPPGRRIIEGDGDMVFPLRDLSNASPRSAYEASFAYSMADINRIAAPMGLPWERSKDIPFGTQSVICYIGLEWDIAWHTVALPHDKREKYRAAISNWTARTTHTLDQVQSLYGKLLHACLSHYPGGPRLPNAPGNFRGTLACMEAHRRLAVGRPRYRMGRGSRLRTPHSHPHHIVRPG
jgi:hypothetical protein